jgi:hypothetical protein
MLDNLPNAIAPPLDELLPLLQHLDQRLEQAVAAAQLAQGEDPAPNPYPGLHISVDEVEQLLARNPTEPIFKTQVTPPSEGMGNLIPENTRLAQLVQTFALSDFEIEVIVIALAPELDRRYENLYAYLQDDLRCKRPSIDLALNLLCTSPADKLAKRSYFTSNAPLLYHRLLQAIAPTANATQLAQEIYLDPQMSQYLLGLPGLDPRLVGYTSLSDPQSHLDQPSLPLPSVPSGLLALTQQHWRERQPLRLYFQGSDRQGQQTVVQALADNAPAPLLIADLPKMVKAKVDWELAFFLLLRQAQWHQTWLYLADIDLLFQEESRSAYCALGAALADHPGLVILSGELPWSDTQPYPLGLLSIPFALPDFDQRRHCWRSHLAPLGLELSPAELDALCDRFGLYSSQIANAVTTAHKNAQWQSYQAGKNGEGAKPAIAELFAAARAESGHALTRLAQKIEPKYGWQDIVLSPTPTAQLQELCNEAKQHHRVWETWGFGHKLSLGKGLNALFSGSPGTGKTMAAEVIAQELQLDLYKIDLSQMVSKFIGETEKNLHQLFNAAANSNAILLFDEADALFGRRSEVKDAHDRYANIETSYLLQKMEEYEGIAILTTNFRSNLDEAFMRRLRFIIEFTLPGKQERRRIWEQILPTEAPRSPDLDLDFLVDRFELTGADIRNIVLRAAFLAAGEQEERQALSMKHIILAIRRDYQKRGRILMNEDLGIYAG